VLTHPDTRYVFVLGAYRDNEVSPTHPLRMTVEKVQKEGVRVHELVLTPLSPLHLSQLVADAVHRPLSEAEPLARLVQEKTAGNPFFVLQFLSSLYEEALLQFDSSSLSWTWDVARIEAKGFTDNVVELVVQKLRRLPKQTQERIKLAACLGNVAEAA